MSADTPPPRSSREALGLAPTRSARASEAGSPRTGGPPVLRTHLWSGVKILLIANIVPLLGLTWLAWAWSQGRISLERMTDEHVVIIVAIIAACVLIAVSSWLVMPVARWLRDYPAWHWRHEGRVLWFLPMVGGLVCWLALWAACLVGGLSAVAMIATALWRLAHRV